MTEASREALDSQFGPPHTGLIYTPPTFSDHIAVSAAFDECLVPRDLKLQSDAATRKAQPHKIQRTIASFFGAPTSSSSASSAAPKTKLKATVVKAPVAKTKKPNFFAPVTNKSKVSSTKTSSATIKRPPSSQPGRATKKQQCRKTEKSTAKTTTILQHFQKQTK